MKKAELDDVQFKALTAVIMQEIECWYTGGQTYRSMRMSIENYLKDVIIVDGEQSK